MNTKNFDKKFNQVMAEFKTKTKKELGIARRLATTAKPDDKAWRTNRVLELERKLKTGSPFNLHYRKRGKYFTNSRGSCELDLIKEYGHSYRWWDMYRRIKGVLCLNSYRYSKQTAKHIQKSYQVLKKLGVKFIGIDAPRGLQNLDCAKQYAADEFGRATVELKYARIKRNWYLSECNTRFKNLKKIGVTVPKPMLEKAIADAEISRKARLERQKIRRAELKSQRETNERITTGQCFQVIQGGAS